jgi:hypothetical protein
VPAPPMARRFGLIASVREFLGVGAASPSPHPSTKSLEENRADILAARSVQASNRLRKLLKRDIRKAWDYFAQLCDGPDANDFHCTMMLAVCKDCAEVERVLVLMERAGVDADSSAMATYVPLFLSTRPGLSYWTRV